MEPGALYVFGAEVSVLGESQLLTTLQFSRVLCRGRLIRVAWNNVLPSFPTTETSDDVLTLSINSRNQPANPTLVCCVCGGDEMERLCLRQTAQRVLDLPLTDACYYLFLLLLLL